MALPRNGSARTVELQENKERRKHHHGIKPVWAIFWSAVFFAFIHLNPWQAVPAFILGCLFGYVYYKTGSLKLTMLMHFTNNTFSLIFSNIDKFKDAKIILRHNESARVRDRGSSVRGDCHPAVQDIEPDRTEFSSGELRYYGYAPVR